MNHYFEDNHEQYESNPVFILYLLLFISHTLHSNCSFPLTLLFPDVPPTSLLPQITSPLFPNKNSAGLPGISTELGITSDNKTSHKSSYQDLTTRPGEESQEQAKESDTPTTTVRSSRRTPSYVTITCTEKTQPRMKHGP